MILELRLLGVMLISSISRVRVTASDASSLSVYFSSRGSLAAVVVVVVLVVPTTEVDPAKDTHNILFRAALVICGVL